MKALNVCREVRVLMTADAVLVVVIRRLALRCESEGIRLTSRLIERVAAMAVEVGIVSSDSAWFAEEDWTAFDLDEAMRVVEESGDMERLARLGEWLDGQSTADIDGYTERAGQGCLRG